MSKLRLKVEIIYGNGDIKETPERIRVKAKNIEKDFKRYILHSSAMLYSANEIFCPISCKYWQANRDLQRSKQ